MLKTSTKGPLKIQHILLVLSVPAHRVGYCQLCMAIPLFKEDKQQSMTFELYPKIAEQLNYSDWRAVERAIRDAITYAWNHRNPTTWEKYFPGCRRAPSNKQFIAVLAEYI